MKNKSIAILLTVVAAVCVLLSGCAETTIEGEWVLVKEIEANGNVLDKDDLEKLGIKESYSIEGESVKYICEVMGKTVPISMKLVETGKKTYDFTVSSLTFASVKLDGKTFSYTVGEGENAVTMVFEKKK